MRLIRSRIPFQFLVSSAMIAVEPRKTVPRKNWTATRKRPAKADWIHVRGPGSKVAMSQQWSITAPLKHYVKLPRMPNAKGMIVLWAAVTLTCATRARLFPSAFS